MFQPQFGNRGTWYRTNTRVAGIVIAGQCIIVLLFFGFGLLLIGTIASAVAHNFDDDHFGYTNTPRMIGIIFLCFGGAIFGIGLILMCFAIRAAREMQASGNQPGHVISSPGPTYQPQPYNANAPGGPPMQPYTLGAGQQAPLLSGTPVQPYYVGQQPPPVQSGQVPYGQPEYSTKGPQPLPYPSEGYPAPAGYPGGSDAPNAPPPPYFQEQK